MYQIPPPAIPQMFPPPQPFQTPPPILPTVFRAPLHSAPPPVFPEVSQTQAPLNSSQIVIPPLAILSPATLSSYCYGCGHFGFIVTISVS